MSWVVHRGGKFLSKLSVDHVEDGNVVSKTAQWFELTDPSTCRFYTYNEARAAAGQHPNAIVMWWTSGELFFPPEAREQLNKLAKALSSAHQQKNAFKRALYAANREANLLRRQAAELEARLADQPLSYMARLWLALRGKVST